MIWEGRLNIVSTLAIAFVSGWLCSSGYYNITHLWQQKNQLVVVQHTVVPKLVTQAKCEHARADVIGKKAVAGDIADPTDLPPDNCPHGIK